MAWDFLSDVLTLFGAGAFLTKEGGSAMKEQVNFEVSEMHREKFFEEWVDKDLEEKLRNVLSDPANYNDVWEQIEEYKRNRGEVYLMRKYFGEKEGIRYHWGVVGEKRLPIRDPRGRVPTAYDRQIYATNWAHTMSMLMNTYGKLTEDDAWYIFDVCYKSIKRYGGVEIMEKQFSRSDFRNSRERLEKMERRDAFIDKWAISFEDLYRAAAYVENPANYDAVWERIEKYKEDNGELYLRTTNFEAKIPQRDPGKIGSIYNNCFEFGRTDWETDKERFLAGMSKTKDGKYKDPRGVRCALNMFINTYGKLSWAQAKLIAFDQEEYGIEF